MKSLLFLSFFICTMSYALPSYTGYSGATGSKGTCASSCHGSGTGTITVTGFPATYVPGKAYTVSVAHSSGSTISNFNASTRIGSTSTTAGTFAALSQTATYTVTGTESGVRASANSIDAATFTWTAPAAGTGTVTFTLSGLQGTKSGANTKVVVTSTEGSATGVLNVAAAPTQFLLEQNYPNPFNPTTNISFIVPSTGRATLRVVNILGQEVATLFDGQAVAGVYNQVQFNASGLASGFYLSRLEYDGKVQFKKMTLLK